MFHCMTNYSKKNAQCLHIIALVCSPKIGNDRQPLKPFNKLSKISFPVKIWEQFNTMGALNYSREFIGSLFELSLYDGSKSFVLMLCSVVA